MRENSENNGCKEHEDEVENNSVQFMSNFV